MLLKTVDEQKITELDLIRLDIHVGYHTILDVSDTAKIEFSVSRCKRQILSGYDLATPHANFYHIYTPADGNDSYYDEHEFYVICERKYIDEGKKLFFDGCAKFCEENIKEQEEKLAEMKAAKANWEKWREETPDTDEKKIAVLCTVTYGKNGLQVTEKEVYRPEGYKKDISVEEKISHAEHFVNSALKVKRKGNKFIGTCWKEDLDACKRMVLDAKLAWVQSEKEKMAKDFDEEEKALEALMQ